MNKEKLQSLTQYAQVLNSKLSDAIPEKHKHRVEAYKTFLKRELDAVTKTIEKLKIQ